MFTVKNVTYDKDNIEIIHSIRHAVFICEQHIASDIEFDGLDSEAIHALVFDGHKAIATGRMLSDGHIGRISVLKEYRSQGVGSKIVESLINQAIKKQYPRVYLGAQEHAITFYSKLGFHSYGDEFIEAGIIHRSMEKALK